MPTQQLVERLLERHRVPEQELLRRACAERVEHPRTPLVAPQRDLDAGDRTETNFGELVVEPPDLAVRASDVDLDRLRDVLRGPEQLRFLSLELRLQRDELAPQSAQPVERIVHLGNLCRDPSPQPVTNDHPGLQEGVARGLLVAVQPGLHALQDLGTTGGAAESLFEQPRLRPRFGAEVGAALSRLEEPCRERCSHQAVGIRCFAEAIPALLARLPLLGLRAKLRFGEGELLLSTLEALAADHHLPVERPLARRDSIDGPVELVHRFFGALHDRGRCILDPRLPQSCDLAIPSRLVEDPLRVELGPSLRSSLHLCVGIIDIALRRLGGHRRRVVLALQSRHQALVALELLGGVRPRQRISVVRHVGEGLRREKQRMSARREGTDARPQLLDVIIVYGCARERVEKAGQNGHRFTRSLDLVPRAARGVDGSSQHVAPLP
ncbi:MAG TPA: hypothetical protein VFG69_16365 [Nannocystaceae bacterium]|nr:hypothetical protein [Nannocystaceae bacterium]